MHVCGTGRKSFRQVRNGGFYSVSKNIGLPEWGCEDKGTSWQFPHVHLVCVTHPLSAPTSWQQVAYGHKMDYTHVESAAFRQPVF